MADDEKPPSEEGGLEKSLDGAELFEALISLMGLPEEHVPEQNVRDELGFIFAQTGKAKPNLEELREVIATYLATLLPSAEGEVLPPTSPDSGESEP